MTKKQLRQQLADAHARIVKLQQKLIEYDKLQEQCKQVFAMNAKLKHAVLKVNGKAVRVENKNGRLKARLEQATDQIAALADLNVMIRSELYANIHAADLRGARAAVQVAELGAVMPNAGKPALVYEDEQEQSRKVKRYGIK